MQKEKERLEELGGRLGFLQRQCKETGIPVLILFDGYDAAGKGYQINRLLQALDPRGFDVYTGDKDGEEEAMRPFLWRFASKAPEKGRIVIFDTSWYRRVMQDRFDGKLKKHEIKEAFEDILAFEKQLAEREDEIIALKNEKERLEAKLNATPPLKALEAKVEKQAYVSPEVEYGAAVIGKIVVEAAKYINRVTSRGEQEYTKELINLILGRTEVAKSEILSIVSSDAGADEKKRGADAQLEQAKDYFESIIAQVQ